VAQAKTWATFSQTRPVTLDVNSNPVTLDANSNPVTLDANSNPVTLDANSNPVTLDANSNLGIRVFKLIKSHKCLKAGNPTLDPSMFKFYFSR
jgi:hypothetical protein